MINLWRDKYKYTVIYNERDRVNENDLIKLMIKTRQELNKESNKNKFDGLFIILSCHGDDENIILSDNKKKSRYKIMEWFNGDNIPFMSNKPKIIIMDACRGNNDIHWGVQNNNNKQVMKGTNDSIHHPDEQFSLLYSTTKGYVVPDDKENGGNLIRTIYELFNNDKKINKYHLNNLFKITQKRVKKICDATQCIQHTYLGMDSHFFIKTNKK